MKKEVSFKYFDVKSAFTVLLSSRIDGVKVSKAHLFTDPALKSKFLNHYVSDRSVFGKWVNKFGEWLREFNGIFRIVRSPDEVSTQLDIIKREDLVFTKKLPTTSCSVSAMINAVSCLYNWFPSMTYIKYIEKGQLVDRLTTIPETIEFAIANFVRSAYATPIWEKYKSHLGISGTYAYYLDIAFVLTVGSAFGLPYKFARVNGINHEMMYNMISNGAVFIGLAQPKYLGSEFHHWVVVNGIEYMRTKSLYDTFDKTRLTPQTEKSPFKFHVVDSFFDPEVLVDEFISNEFRANKGSGQGWLHPDMNDHFWMTNKVFTNIENTDWMVIWPGSSKMSDIFDVIRKDGTTLKSTKTFTFDIGEIYSFDGKKRQQLITSSLVFKKIDSDKLGKLLAPDWKDFYDMVDRPMGFN